MESNKFFEFNDNNGQRQEEKTVLKYILEHAITVAKYSKTILHNCPLPFNLIGRIDLLSRRASQARTMTDKPPIPPDVKKVLIAEDNPVVLKGLQNFLAKWGFKPITAADGDEAWRILDQDHSVCLAIVDWNLPGLSGLQICQRLRTRTAGPYVYTIMFSSRKSIEEKLLALDGGADDYLVKPCKPSELRARLGVGRRIIEYAFNIPSQNLSMNVDDIDAVSKTLNSDSPPPAEESKS